MGNQHKSLNLLAEQQHDIANNWADYWSEFSSISTWGFWIHAAMLILPLVLLYFTLDKSKAFQIGFFGFNVHVWFGYFDTFGTVQGYWTYPYQLVPFLPNSFGLDASLIPVLFMLVYQWVIHTRRNYYLYTLILSVFLSFAVKPLFVSINVFKFYLGVNYLHLFLTYLVILVVSKLLTDLFMYFQKVSNQS